MKLVYDLETMKNCFLFGAKWDTEGKPFFYLEISNRVDQREWLIKLMNHLRAENATMVGYNNVNFDYTILHEFINDPYSFTAAKANDMATEIIKHGKYTTIKPKDRYIKQLDLFKINGFDNQNKLTSLKALEFAMRLDDVSDLPFDPSKNLTDHEMDLLIQYLKNDIEATTRFLRHNKPPIEFRESLLKEKLLYGDVMNFSDVKIGTNFLVNRIGYDNCYYKSPWGRKQTPRERVIFKNIILPNISFQTDCQEVLDYYMSINYDFTGARPSFDKTIGGIEFAFGLGGVHASRIATRYDSNDEFVIKDIDVGGMYPSVTIANGFEPEHLKGKFSKPYESLKVERAQYAKGTAKNKSFKLAANGAYGQSSDPYSCFYDPQHTYSVTVNGQLQILMLVEELLMVPDLELIQANTDGITVYMRRSDEILFDYICHAWEGVTGLQLEHNTYKMMYVRDVNSYLAIKGDGGIKAIGAYKFPRSWKDYDDAWNENYNEMIVPKAVEYNLLHGIPVEEYIRLACDPFDFMFLHKNTGGATSYLGESELGRHTRAYVSLDGEEMKIIRPPLGPLGHPKRKPGVSKSVYKAVMIATGNSWDPEVCTKNKSVYDYRPSRIRAGHKVSECNNSRNFNFSNVDYDYYIEKAKNLLF